MNRLDEQKVLYGRIGKGDVMSDTAKQEYQHLPVEDENHTTVLKWSVAAPKSTWRARFHLCLCRPIIQSTGGWVLVDGFSYQKSAHLED